MHIKVLGFTKKFNKMKLYFLYFNKIELIFKSTSFFFFFPSWNNQKDKKKGKAENNGFLLDYRLRYIGRGKGKNGNKDGMGEV